MLMLMYRSGTLKFEVSYSTLLKISSKNGSSLNIKVPFIATFHQLTLPLMLNYSQESTKLSEARPTTASSRYQEINKAKLFF